MWPWKNDMYLNENPRPSFLVQFLLSVQCYKEISLFFEKIIHNYIAQSSYKNEQKLQVRKATDITLELDNQHSIILVLKIHDILFINCPKYSYKNLPHGTPVQD